MERKGRGAVIYITGDCHGEFNKLSSSSFPEQRQMTKKDTLIICGDFGGVWDTDPDSSCEAYWLRWLDEKPFTTVFVDGNHENFDRLNNEFPVVSFCGGKAHRIRDSIFHLMRGEIYEIEGKKFFVFGGAKSHDIRDGILSRKDFGTDDQFKAAVRKWKRQKKQFRIEHETWWQEELPNDEEIKHAKANLAAAGYRVDHVITHCAPQSIAEKMYNAPACPDKLTDFFDELLPGLEFRYWFFGHYHEDRKINNKFILLYDQIIRIG